MNDHELVLVFVQSCASGKLGSPECSPVFMLGGIALATVILAMTLAALMISRAKKQSATQTGLPSGNILKAEAREDVSRG
jgi:hypothetical protein